jgi:hypothetical protein
MQQSRRIMAMFDIMKENHFYFMKPENPKPPKTQFTSGSSGRTSWPLVEDNRIVVSSLNLDDFKRRLIEHFDIAFQKKRFVGQEEIVLWNQRFKSLIDYHYQ